MTYFVGGSIIGVSNLIICLSIVRYEALRTNKVYVLIMAQSFADFSNMLAFTIAGIRWSLLIFSGQHNTLYTVWQCAQVPHAIIWSYSPLVANVMLSVVSLDRLLCVQSPLRYIGWTYKYTMALAGSAYLYSFACGAIGLTWAYVTRDDQTPVIPAPCVTQNVLGKVHFLYDLRFNQAPMFWAFLSVSMYLVVWIIYVRQNSQINTDDQAQQHQVEHQRRFTKSLGISCLCSFCLFIVPWQLGTIANKWGSRSLAMIMWTASNLNPFANVIIYLKRHEEMREALKGLFTCKHMSNDVQTWKANRQASKAQRSTTAARSTSKPIRHNNQVNVIEL